LSSILTVGLFAGGGLMVVIGLLAIAGSRALRFPE
jgi:hypothetical protein